MPTIGFVNHIISEVLALQECSHLLLGVLALNES